MSRTAEQTHDGALFPEAIDPSYLLNMTCDNDMNFSYGGYQVNFPPMGNADLTNTLFADNTSTGFTPPLFTPNGTSFFNAMGVESQQSYLGGFDGQQNGYFQSQAVVPPQVLTNMPIMDSSNDSQNDNTEPMDSQSTTVDNHDSRETLRESRSKQKEETSPPETYTAPVVRKRRARKNKKQLSEDEIRAKRERFLERNRIAASKCRDKKKDWTGKMEEKMRNLQSDRNMLRELVQTLMDEKRKLTALLHEHSGCNHQGLDAWLKEKATAILSSPDVFTPVLSPKNLLQSGSSSPVESRDHSLVNGYEGSRRNSMVFKQANTMSAHQTNMHPFSPSSQDKFKQKPSSNESMNSDHSACEIYRPNSGNSDEQHGYNRDSGISDMESLEMSPVDGASLFDVPEVVQTSSASSEGVLMGNQRLIGHGGYREYRNECHNTQYARA